MASLPPATVAEGTKQAQPWLDALKEAQAAQAQAWRRPAAIAGGAGEAVIAASLRAASEAIHPPLQGEGRAPQVRGVGPIRVARRRERHPGGQ